MEIKKVLIRKDGIKYVIIPKNSEIKEGDTVLITNIKSNFISPLTSEEKQTKW